MRNFNYPLITTLFAFLFCSFSVLHGQGASKTLVKSFNLQGLSAVALQLDAPTEVAYWDNNTVRIQLSIALDSGSEALIKSLVRAGRYNLQGEELGQVYTITAPNIGREVKIGGKVLEESISVSVFLPRGVQFEAPAKEEGALSAEDSM